MVKMLNKLTYNLYDRNSTYRNRKWTKIIALMQDVTALFDDKLSYDYDPVSGWVWAAKR